MATKFNKKGQLNIPLSGKIILPKRKVAKKQSDLVVKEAYCPNGHNLLSDEKIDNQKSQHFIYASRRGNREAEILITSVLGKCSKKYLNGEPFRKGEIIRILCPTCRGELPILVNCECGAPIYLFYIDRRLDHNFGQSLCARIGCVKASQLRFSQDVLREFINNYGF
jgi:hypothetical protein